MTHCNKGHFKAKHPPGTTVAPAVAEAVGKQLSEKAMTCQSAHALAGSLGVAPGDIGVAIDLQEGQIQKCQLGLFGYGTERKAIQPAKQVAPDLKAAIEASLVDGRLGCAAAWRIADTSGIARMAVANACEALKIKINACQLGAF
ncbi:MAG: hypothetical protein KFF50_09825 [Desulfatitalea sp.]|nr:hypothetical protein [Desulfatitalea sp.]